MCNRSINLDETLHNYLLSVSVREPEILKKLRAETSVMKDAVMQISPEQGQLISLLLKLIGAKRTIEIGVFTGYSSLITAFAIPDDGEIIACDINPTFTAIAEKYWKEAGVDHKIKLYMGMAEKTLQELIYQGKEESFDFAFIDADKHNYKKYFEQCIELIRPNGIIMVDNVLWGGRVYDESFQDPAPRALRKFNQKIFDDGRIDISMIPIGDGLTLARKK